MTAEDRGRIRELVQGRRPPVPVLLVGGPANGTRLHLTDPAIDEVAVPDYSSPPRPAGPRDQAASPYAVPVVEVPSLDVVYRRAEPQQWSGPYVVFTLSGRPEPAAAEWWAP